LPPLICGRLCLLSQADYKIGISPALGQSFGHATVNLITTMRAHRVREERAGINFDTLNMLPLWDGAERQHAMIIYSAKDVPEIKTECQGLERQGVRVELVENSVHSDIFLNEKTFQTIQAQIKAWFPTVVQPDPLLQA